MMTPLLYGLLALTLSLLLPVRLHILGTLQYGEVTEPGAGGEVQLGWAFGLISLRAQARQPLGIYFFGLRVLKLRLSRPSLSALLRRLLRDRQNKNNIAKKKTKTESKLLRWITHHPLLIWAVVKRTLPTMHLSGRLGGRLGTGNPAHTAGLHLVLMQTSAILPRLQLQISSDYLNELIVLEAGFESWFLPGRVLAATGSSLLRHGVRRILPA